MINNDINFNDKDFGNKFKNNLYDAKINHFKGLSPINLDKNENSMSINLKSNNNLEVVVQNGNLAYENNLLNNISNYLDKIKSNDVKNINNILTINESEQNINIDNQENINEDKNKSVNKAKKNEKGKILKKKNKDGSPLEKKNLNNIIKKGDNHIKEEVNKKGNKKIDKLIDELTDKKNDKKIENIKNYNKINDIQDNLKDDEVIQLENIANSKDNNNKDFLFDDFDQIPKITAKGERLTRNLPVEELLYQDAKRRQQKQTA